MAGLGLFDINGHQTPMLGCLQVGTWEERWELGPEFERSSAAAVKLGSSVALSLLLRCPTVYYLSVVDAKQAKRHEPLIHRT